MRKQKDIEKAALKAYKDIVDIQKNSFYNIFKAGVEYADTHSINGSRKIDLDKEIQTWYSGSFPLPWCTVKDAVDLTARHFFKLGLEHKQKVWTEEDEIKRDLVYNALNSTYDIGQSAVLSQWLNSKLKATGE